VGTAVATCWGTLVTAGATAVVTCWGAPVTAGKGAVVGPPLFVGPDGIPEERSRRSGILTRPLCAIPMNTG
jgi:hypothetical protein